MRLQVLQACCSRSYPIRVQEDHSLLEKVLKYIVEELMPNPYWTKSGEATALNTTM